MTRTRQLLLWLAAWTAAAGLLWLASLGADWRAATHTVSGAQTWWLTAAVGANLTILLLWAALWRLLLPRATEVRYGRMLEIASVTSAIMNTVPALVGHASAVALLVRRGGMPIRSAGAVITLDQVGEGVSKLAVLAIALQVIDLPTWMRIGALSIGLAVAALVVAVAALVSLGGRAFGDTAAGLLLNAVRADLHAIRSPGRALGALGIAFAMKAAEAVAIAGVMVALGLDFSVGAAFVVLGAVNLATMLPVSPGNVGTYEAGAVAAYRLLGVPPEVALAAAMVQHACFLLPAVGAGVVALATAGAETIRLPFTATPADPA